MVSKHLYGAVRVHDTTLRQIAATFGSRSFTNVDLRAAGMDLAGIMTSFHRSGCIERVGWDGRGKGVWKLSSELVDHYAAEATA